MTNIEKYNKILKANLDAKDEDLNDDRLVYNLFENWDSITHFDIVSEVEEKFGVAFETLDITSFSKYSKGIEILESKGVDMKA